MATQVELLSMAPDDAVRAMAAEIGIDLSSKDVEYIIRNKTGYPAFWHIPRDGATPVECFLKQVRDALASWGKDGSARAS